MANEGHLEILNKGVTAWNEWRTQNPGIRPDFRRARLNGADLSTAILSWADLAFAELAGADLTKAQLIGADLSWANLFGANLTDASMGMTRLADIDFSTAKGIETVQHIVPSTLGIDTIYRSKGNIPDVFLRGAGVPEPFIVQMKGLVGAMEPIQFYSCFISYSSKDDDFAKRLYADLQQKNVRCWFAPHDAQGGKKLHEQIDRAIQVQDRLLLVLSAHSMASEWVKTEVAKARQREKKENRRVLFPIRLCSFEDIREWECFDADVGKDSAREVREYFIPDFSKWKQHDNYRNAFESLMRDLQSEEKPK